MAERQTFPGQQAAVERLSKIVPRLARSSVGRKLGIAAAEKLLLRSILSNSGDQPPGVVRDQVNISMALLHAGERALTEYHLSEAVLHGFFDILARDLLINSGASATADRFTEEHGWRPPSLLLISPTKLCNLRCVGCYADAEPEDIKLPFDAFDRIVKEARSLWGVRFIPISGGEPLAYRWDGKDILDIAERNPESFFMMYTNGTLITDQVAERMAELGNLSPVLSLEGWREKTDARRGKGVFDKVILAMKRLHSVGVPFGVSFTATRYNCEELLSDEFIDYCFLENKALYGWMFQYMPIGRSMTLELMPTPEQRRWMWDRSWQIIREKRIFLADFWNHGTLCGGCLSAGGSNTGGYMVVNWNGAVTPCVFVPYSPVNVLDVYAQGGNLNDVWANPFFADLRAWQKEHKNEILLNPCPIRDHHSDIRRLLYMHEPTPLDHNAEEALLDPKYAEGLEEYGQAYGELAKSLWEEHYLKADITAEMGRSR